MITKKKLEWTHWSNGDWSSGDGWRTYVVSKVDLNRRHRYWTATVTRATSVYLDLVCQSKSLAYCKRKCKQHSLRCLAWRRQDVIKEWGTSEGIEEAM